MEKINKAIKLKFLFSMLFTIMLPVGILCIIFGAINKLTFLLVIGIVLAVLGFYGTPILWINYAETIHQKALLRLIEEENIFSVKDLSNQLLMNEKSVLLGINKLILKNYLTGYLLVGGTLQPNTNKKQSQRVVKKMKCKQCGGVMEFDGAQYVCKYCGNIEQTHN